ncbi:thermonuclease family protein [Synechococcus sp. 1G10]|uniref:thermonuclease family protein n=1 Tax=Synechococcus sp. 1G10 TaxID=2025605 RepID=UPI001E29448E|nr:thermonuclease family protein [Synechococcus sp. 1G10]
MAEVIGVVNLNLAMVEDGQAFVYRKYLCQCDSKKYLDAEARASRRRVGVWQMSGGITRPWDFRRVKASTRSGADSGSIPGGRRYRCSELSSYARAQELLSQGHRYLDSNSDGEACESLRR